MQGRVSWRAFMRLELQVALAALCIAAPLTAVLRLKTRPNRRAGFESVPRIGGFSILSAFFAAPAIVAIFSDDARRYVREDWSAMLALGICGTLVFLVGARDDFRPGDTGNAREAAGDRVERAIPRGVVDDDSTRQRCWQFALDRGEAFERKLPALVGDDDDAEAHGPAAWRRSGEERWWKVTGGVYRSAPYVPRATRAPVPRPGTSSRRGAFPRACPASPGNR